MVKHYLKIIVCCTIAFVIAITMSILFPNPSGFPNPYSLPASAINIGKFFVGFVVAQAEILLYDSKRPQFSHDVFNQHSNLIAAAGIALELTIIIFIICKRNQTLFYVKQRWANWTQHLNKTKIFNPYWKLTGILFLCFWLIFNCYELELRRSNFYPGMGFGYVTSNGFRHVDSLITMQYQIADSEGMACFDTRFSFYMDSLRRINKQGFLSGFDYDEQTVDSFRNTGKKIVFVIGDSFVEGVSDNGADKTFIEIMRHIQNRYAIFSFGVRGTDPLNYWLTAKRFVPKLYPDLVIVCFCGQNDFMPFDRKLIPGLPVLLQGNAGELTSNIPLNMVGTRDSFLYSYKKAYEFYLSKSTLWGKNENRPLAKICRRSSMLTRVYYKFHPPTAQNFTDTLASSQDSMVSYKYLHSIDSLCQKDSVPFVVAFIPQGTAVTTGKEDDYELQYKRQLGDIFFKTKFPHGFIYKRDYIIPEAHFNVSGNERFAKYLLDSVIVPQFQ